MTECTINMNTGYVLAIRRWVTGGVLCCIVFNAGALSIGRARSVTLLGKPLDFSVPISLDAQDDASQLCPEADVYFGDNRLGTSDIAVTIARGAGQESVLRVRTNTVIDEPVVTVFVRAGCGQKSQRRFVLLADIETEATLPTQAERRGSALSQGPSSTTAPIGIENPSQQPATRSRSQRGGGEVADQKRRPLGDRPKSVVRRDIEKAEPAARTLKPAARLKVDTLDPLAELFPALKGSAEMLSAPNEEQRRTASALWRAINAQPQDVLRDAERLQTLETNVKSLQAQTQNNQTAVADVKVQLDQARKERYANPLVYGLAGLLLASLALAAYLWSRSGRVASAGAKQPWWSSKRAGGEPENEARSPRASSVAYPSSRAAAAKINTEEVDEYTTDMLELPEGDDFTLEHVAPVAAQDRAIFAQSDVAASRTVDAEELFDIQQQADFFISLGQYDQAIEVLQNHISDNVETSALAYLDLLDLYVKLGRRDDYDALRQDFNRVFNGQVPDFDNYNSDGRGIEAYQTALSRIEQLWNEPKVLGVIEESLFRKPDHEGQAFDLQAYRELLLLYSVAKENAGGGQASIDLDLPLDVEADSTEARDFSLTAVQPLSTSPRDRSLQTTPISERDYQDLAEYSKTAQPTANLQVLDIDLGAMDDDQGAKPMAESQWIEFDLDELNPKSKK
jgi:hypothetical protein